MMKNMQWFFYGKAFLLAALAVGLGRFAVAAESGVDLLSDGDGDGTSVSITINPNPKPTLDYTSASYNGLFILSPVTLFAAPSYYADYLFSLNKTPVYDGPDSRVTVSKPLYYNKRPNHASVLVTDENGCKGVAEIDFPLKALLPNVFQPGSGHNELFLRGYNLKITNRYGHVLYTGKDGWNGRYKGKDMPAGTYFYEVQIPVDEGVTQPYAGAVLLERVN